MAHAYLKAFQQRVRNAHDSSGLTCHWTKTDELTETLLFRDSKGPCNCPTPPASGACSQHSQFNCANTAAVLGIKTDAEKHYAPVLDKLGRAMSEIEDTIKSAEEAIRNLIKGGMNRSDALDDSVLTTIMRGHIAPDRPSVHDILENLALDLKPSTDLAPASCRCECYENKVHRLQAEKDFIDKLITQAGDQSPEVLKAYNDGKATFSNTLGAVLKGSIKIVAGVAAGKEDTVISGVSDLLQYYKKGLGEGGQLYILYKAIAEIGELKRLAMLGVIYHDQQLRAPTCVLDETSQKIVRPPGTGSTSGSGTEQPPGGTPKTCQTEHRDLETCKELGEDGFKHESSKESEAADKALEKIRDDYKDSFESIDLEDSEPSRDFCPGKGRHYNVRGKNKRTKKREKISSVVTCPCCRDTEAGPKIFWRARTS